MKLSFENRVMQTARGVAARDLAGLGSNVVLKSSSVDYYYFAVELVDALI